MDLDAVYDTLKKLNFLSTTDGSAIISGLNKLILSLKEHWIGSDATLHINNLIKVYNDVNKVVENVNLVAHNTSSPIVNAQSIRNANGGYGEVGEIIPLENKKMEVIENLNETKQYYVDPVLIKQDFENLITQKENFNNFCTQFSNFKDELFNNWMSGSDRDKIYNDFSEFENDADAYKKIFIEIEQTMSTVISNLRQI